jgi:hypothetical protein
MSNDAVYLWLNAYGWAPNYFMISDHWIRRLAGAYMDDGEEEDEHSVVYRIPIDGSEPPRSLFRKP